MIKLHYDPRKKVWFQNKLNTALRWGKNQTKIIYSGGSKIHSLPFTAFVKQERVGPLVGILTSPSKNAETFTGSIRSFRRIQKELQQQGGMSIVFTPEGLQNDHVHGFMYYLEANTWVKVITPLPDIVYNRIPVRKDEQTENFIKTIKRIYELKIPCFNPHFFNKWETYNVLASSETLSSYLPYTREVINKESFTDFLSRFSAVYVKPIQGHKGKGVFTIQRNRDSSIEYRDMNRLQTYRSIDELWDAVSPDLLKESYIVQQAVSSDTINDKKYDLRTLVHNRNGNYVISGIGVRQSQKQTVTTHVPNGGTILPFEAVKERVNIDLITSITKDCGAQLSKKFGFIGEFSIDLGISTNGQYYIYEINSKPMVFDEPPIKEQGLKNLVHLFKEKTYF